jgi:hypothetical protein
MKLKKIVLSILSFIFMLVLFQNCSSKSSLSDVNLYPFSNSNLYFKNTQRIIVEVYYDVGAEPFVGTFNFGKDYWDILDDNIQAIFQYRSQQPEITVPKQLSEMYALPNQDHLSWTIADIDSLNSHYKQKNSSQEEAHFYLYFLNGYFNDETNDHPEIIGLNINGTPIIAIFKDVIKNSGISPSGPIPKYVEQSTMVHELGHALGFVNNGVPMALNHQDKEHGTHTTNKDCVMYWQNEGLGDLKLFVQKFITTNETVLWGPEVLNDAKAYSE